MNIEATVKNYESMTDAQFDAYIAQAAREERERGLANASRVGTDWCRCSETVDQENYYQRANGRHGWFHDPALGGCGGITQTG